MAKKVDLQERQVLQARNAICDNCGGMQPMKEQFSFREIAVLTGCGTEKGGQLAYQAALDCLIRQLTEDEVFRIMNLKQKAVTRRKRKSPPQSTCIRQTATANGAKCILILQTKRQRSSSLRTGISPDPGYMPGQRSAI